MFTVYSHNVLARRFTKHFKNAHGHVDDDGLEAEWQTKQRYSLGAASILAERADVVCLQECGGDFFQSSWNEHSQQIAADFSIYQCYGRGKGPGTALLLRKAGRLKKIPSEAVHRVGGDGSTGDSSKKAICVPLENAGTGFQVWVVSTHFTMAEKERLHHITLIGDAIGKSSIQDCVLVGDFNANPRGLAALRTQTWLGTLNRVNTGEGFNTVINKDMRTSACVDHICISKGLAATAVGVEKTPPSSPYSLSHDVVNDGGAVIRGASDHCWIMATLKHDVFAIHSHQVLARRSTNRFQIAHGNDDVLEAHWQTKRRHSHAGASILTQRTDVVCLQECSGEFLEGKYNSNADAILTEFIPYTCFSRPGKGPGAVTLLRRDGAFMPVATQRVCKDAFCVLCIAVEHVVTNLQCWIVNLSSFSSTSSANETKHAFDVQHAIELIRNLLDGTGIENVVFVGHFDVSTNEIIAKSWLGTLQHVNLDVETNTSRDDAVMTKMQGRGHMFVSSSFMQSGLKLEGKNPRSPYAIDDRHEEGGRSKICGASDSAWFRTTLSYTKVGGNRQATRPRNGRLELEQHAGMHRSAAVTIRTHEAEQGLGLENLVL
jgi:endonuclease/exonuclease/phosphatase family metal-dependent hydrolase